MEDMLLLGLQKGSGSPLGYSVFQQILQGRGLDGAFETPQALTLSDIRSPAIWARSGFLEKCSWINLSFLDTYIIRIRHWFTGIHGMGIVHKGSSIYWEQFSWTTNSYPNGSHKKCIKGSGEHGRRISGS